MSLWINLNNEHKLWEGYTYDLCILLKVADFGYTIKQAIVLKVL